MAVAITAACCWVLLLQCVSHMPLDLVHISWNELVSKQRATTVLLEELCVSEACALRYGPPVTLSELVELLEPRDGGVILGGAIEDGEQPVGCCLATRITGSRKVGGSLA
jgi:hypothetical protein